jgi:tRNA pseudouridine32 synthase/23S rRNA pseudouridine746 synthase
LKAETDLDDLVPIHRIDRETAGIVLFSKQKATRGIYHDLFQSGHAHKIYEAVTTLPDHPEQREWLLHTRIVRGEPWFLVQHAEGAVNAITKILLLDRNERFAYLRLEPRTGKQHQLRLHVTLIGAQILYDRYYPVLTPKRPDDFARPLQLLAKSVAFIDPVSRQPMEFRSMRQLWELAQCDDSVKYTDGGQIPL